LFVTGRLGQAEYGLRLIRQRRRRVPGRDRRLHKHLYPEPRLAVGRWLAENHMASAMMDLSDGLSTDLARLCTASRVGARVYADRLPTLRESSSIGLGRKNPLNLALHG